MRWLSIALTLALAGCHKKPDCPAAMKAASKAVWAYQPVDKQRDTLWQTSIDLEKANNDAMAAAINDVDKHDCHTISLALQHPKTADVELLRLAAAMFQQDVKELENDPTLDPALVTKMKSDEPAFDDALQHIPKAEVDSITALAPTPTSTKALKVLEAAWCTLRTSFGAVQADEIVKLKAERDRAYADTQKIGAQAKADSDHWTQAQDFAKAIDAHKVAPPLTAPGDLATEPGFGSARAALAAANAACD
jgi:hypothetical protein